MTFYTGDAFPNWRGDLFVGSLKFGYVARLDVEDGRIVGEERLIEDLDQRIRDVRQGPDGNLYLLTDEDEGAVLKLAPASKS
jgi:glucose/arabinose dehydrogenase